MWVASCCQEKLSLGKHVDISWANFVPHSVIVCWYLFVCVLDVLAFVHDAQKPTCSQALSTLYQLIKQLYLDSLSTVRGMIR